MVDANRAITTIIFDLNGVFIVCPKLSERFEKDFNVPLDKFLPVLKEIMHQVRQPGLRGIYQLWEPHLKEWGVGLSENEFLDYWFQTEVENTALTDLARVLKARGLRLIILSNNFHERSEYYTKNFPFLSELFDGVYYSWQTGFVKPSSQAFQNVLDQHNLKAEECMFFDDSEKNVEIAKTLGIESYIFDDQAVKKLEGLAE
jgi:putative hydrolase of the HAD superfamily